MLIDYVNGQTSVILRAKLRQDNTGAKPGQGFTGVTNSSTGLIVSTIADNESSATVYTSAASHTETITTLGTYATPTASKCRIKEVDATNHPGLVELQIADARFGVANAKELTITISGVSGLADCDIKIPLRSVNPYDGVHGGMSALPNTACTTNASLVTSGTGTDQLSVASGRVDLGKVLGTTSTGAAGYVGVDWGQITNKTTTNALTGTTISTSQVAASVTAAVTAGTVSDKTGYSLAAGGLDSITTTEPDTSTNGAMSTWNFRLLMRWAVSALSNGTRTLSGGAGTLTVKKLGGTTATSQTIADDGAGNETLGAPT